MPLDSYGKKSSSASSSLSYQRQQLQNGSKTGGFDFSSLMQQASSNSVDASQKITKIDKSVSAEARARASKNAIDISAAKLRKAVLERSSHKSSAVSHSADLKHHKHHKEHSKDHPAKDSAKRENSTSGLSDKDRRDKHGDKQLNGTKSLSKDKERGGKPSGQSVGASSSSKQPSKSGLGLSVGQEQKRHLAGDLRYKGETAPTSSRDGADRKTSSKPTSSSVKRPHQQMKRPAPSGMDFSKLMQQASSNLSGKPLKLTGADSGELPSNRKSMGVPAGEPRRSSTERFSSSSSSTKHSSAPRRPGDSKIYSKERVSLVPAAKDTVIRQSTGRPAEKTSSREGAGKSAGKNNVSKEEANRGRSSQPSSASTSRRLLPGDARAKTQPQPSASSSSGSAQPQHVKRYLPGDARYTGGPPRAGPEGLGKKPIPAPTPSTMHRQQLQNGARRPGEIALGKRSRSPPRPTGVSSSSATVYASKKPRRDPSPVDDNLARIRARERMRYEAERRAAAARHDDEDMLDEDEDEYDSEMDDFIDDTELDDLQRGDFEETLRMINPRYNKEKWKRREKEIDERQMIASFRDITAEEKRSARLGLLEDVKEAQKGRSVAL